MNCSRAAQSGPGSTPTRNRFGVPLTSQLQPRELEPRSETARDILGYRSLDVSPVLAADDHGTSPFRTWEQGR
jgi:hypothetical protein